jgi:hypothetical protein
MYFKWHKINIQDQAQTEVVSTKLKSLIIVTLWLLAQQKTVILTILIEFMYNFRMLSTFKVPFLDKKCR